MKYQKLDDIPFDLLSLGEAAAAIYEIAESLEDLAMRGFDDRASVSNPHQKRHKAQLLRWLAELQELRAYRESVLLANRHIKR